MNTHLNSVKNTFEINLIQRYLAAFSTNDIEKALDCIHEDAVWHIDGDPLVQTVGLIKGHNQIKQWLITFPAAFKPLEFSIDRFVNVAQDVLVMGRFRHVVLTTNTIVDSDYIIKFTIADKKIIRYQIFEDSLLISQVHTSPSVSRKIDINGTTYSWDDTGHGSPIIFLHGLFLERSFWNPIIARLPDYRCIAFDMPGHASSGWRDSLDLDGIAEDIVLWMKEYRIQKATIVGHSQGGMIAMRIAAKYPEMLDRLIVINTSARKEYQERTSLWFETEKILSSKHSNRLQLFKEIQNMKLTAEWMNSNPQAVHKELLNMMNHKPENLAHALKAAILDRRDIRNLLKNINAKTIVLSGDQDNATPLELGKEIANLIPKAVHEVVLNTAHSIPIEAPNKVVEILLNH